MAAIYAVAFFSLSVQVAGLIGAHGILPAQEFFTQVARQMDPTRFIVLPSVFWFNASDAVMRGACFAGIALAALLFAGILQRACLALLFVLYLSFSSAGQDFLGFQWDALLLETGFLAIFFGRSGITTWLFRALLFRLYFLSGAVKLLSHDAAWRNLSAAGFHYRTQPLPTVLAWYADRLPQWFQRASTFGVLAIEIVVPFFIFAPRRLRVPAAYILILLQVWILATGNYAFFNLLTIALCLFLFDEPAFPKFAQNRVAGAGAAVILILGLTRIVEALTGVAIPRVPFDIVNSYGLFAVLTTSRPEIAIEGSDDGANWRAYEFRYKPGELDRRPRWVAPHQPRLDWQMWFAALGNYRQNPWFVNFAARLLQGSPAVLDLLETNPFPNHAPKYVRALVYEYSFTDAETRRRTGAWWKRERLGTYLPAISLRSFTPE